MQLGKMQKKQAGNDIPEDVKHLPGCMMHLWPPGVVGVIDEEEDLAPEQHQGGVSGDQRLAHAVQIVQAVKTPLTVIPVEQLGSSCSDSSEHAWRKK